MCVRVMTEGLQSDGDQRHMVIYFLSTLRDALLSVCVFVFVQTKGGGVFP